MAKERGQAGKPRPPKARDTISRASPLRSPIVQLPEWPLHDPGYVALRRATRAAVVTPLAVAFALFVLRNAQATIYVAFGCFALLVMADFAGSRRSRAAAYIGATLVGSVLITLGTLASFSPWVGTLAMLLIGFAVTFSGVFGGYVAAAQPALLLAFVLSVAVPVSPTAIPSRLLGWGIAGVISAVAGVALWPRFERPALRIQTAAACRALAALVRAKRVRPAPPNLAKLQQEAQRTVEEVKRAYAATPNRPAGPAQRDRAFASLLSELQRILGYIAIPSVWSLAAQHPCLREGDVLAAGVAQTLEASADVLSGGTPPDLVGLQTARVAHRSALDRWAAEALRGGSEPEDVLIGFEADNPLRVVALLVLALGADAMIASGRRLPSELVIPLAIPRDAGAAAMVRRTSETMRTHLHFRSSVLQNSLRVALGLALAVLLGGLLQIAHAFWVVLGTLSALRSSALATGRTTVQALVGTVIGVAIGAPFIYVVGKDTTILWFVYPVAIFLAAYAATVIGFVAGQAAFTLVIVVLFNLLAPSGWRVGLVRLEDVALGVGISVVVGLLLWPRGLRAELRRALADLYHAVAQDLAAALNQILGNASSDVFIQTQSRTVRASVREGEAFDQYARERGSRHLDLEIAAALAAAGRNVMVAADLLHSLAESGYYLRHPVESDEELIGQVRALTGAYEDLGDQLERGTATHPASQRVSDMALRAAELDYLRHWKLDSAQEQSAVAVVAASEWIRNLAALAAEQEPAVAKVIEAAKMPWWQ